MRTFITKVATMLILVLTATGCVRVRSAPVAPGVQSATPRVVVVGVDRTGSYSILPRAVQVLAAFFLQNAHPGDTWVFRYIEANSFSDRAAIALLPGGRSMVSLPQIPPKPANLDVLNRRKKLAYLAGLRKFSSLRADVGRRIKALRPQPVQGTDIWGFLAKAQQLRATHIIMVTDLGDTMNRRTPLQLRNVRIIVLGIQSGRDPSAAFQRWRWWEEQLRQAGAEVEFYDLSQPVPKL